MRAVQLNQYVRSPQDLTVKRLPDPEPSPNEYTIEVSAAAANVSDLLQIQGRYQNQPPFPWIAGAEFAGTVIATPPRRTRSRSKSRSDNDPDDDTGHDERRSQDRDSEEPFPVGTRVFGAAQGAFATRVCVPAVALRPIPDGWSFREAAGLFSAAPAAFAALVLRAQIKEGDWLLVHAAAGGCGLAAIQIAKAYGARVIAMVSSSPPPSTSTSPSTPASPVLRVSSPFLSSGSGSAPASPDKGSADRKLRVARHYGADHVLSYDEPDWPAKVRALTPRDRGVDIVLDPIGLIDRSIQCTAWNGRVLVVGFAGGRAEYITSAKVLLKNIALVGIYWGGYYLHEPEAVPLVWEGVSRLIDEGKFKPLEYGDEEFVGLVQVKEALAKLAKRETWGKVVIRIPKDRTKAKL